MNRHRQTTIFERGMRGAAMFVVLAAAAGCGDTLVDHDGGKFVTSCQGTVTSCGQGSACVDCSAGSVPADAAPVCTAAATCGYECNPGWLHCDAGCCRALSVATGWYHTCAILAQPPATSGQLRCWGANEYGQLGREDKLYLDSPVPVDVAGMASGVTQVAAGSYHTCAIQNGNPYCWGWNDLGQVGAGTTLPTYDWPQAVFNVPTGAIAQLAPGGKQTCALYGSGGTVSCWGANDRGQLGQGTTDATSHNIPIPVPSLANVTSLAAGRFHACAVAGSAVTCWGSDDYGEIGDGAGALGRNVPTPTAAGAFTTATAVAAGDQFSLAIATGTPDPQLWGWGTNSSGQLGSPHPPDAVSNPTLATISVKPTAVTAGRAHACALKTDGLKCFGANDHVQLGDPVGNSVDVNFGVASLPVQVAAGYDHTCARLQDGSLYCWGKDDRGQVGNGVADILNPVGKPTLVTGR